jgi:hypothetical protein
MRPDLDTRARMAAAGLRSAVDRAELTSMPPQERFRGSTWVFRPAWVMAAVLFVGAAIGVAMVLEPSESAPTTVPTTTTPSTTTTLASTTTVPSLPVVPGAVPPSTTVSVDTTPPPLEITSPEDGATVAERTVVFSGTTEPGASVFAGRWQADVSGDGSWSIALVLSEGANRARFVARDAAGNETEAAITVHYVPTTTTTKPQNTEPELANFTAFAKFGSCSETPPYDIYYGTGQPGSRVFVSSEYGSGSVKVADSGEWEVKVFFETAPIGKSFVVKVHDEFGRKKTLDFVYTP